jgi:hypothetical protein
MRFINVLNGPSLENAAAPGNNVSLRTGAGCCRAKYMVPLRNKIIVLVSGSWFFITPQK